MPARCSTASVGGRADTRVGVARRSRRFLIGLRARRFAGKYTNMASPLELYGRWIDELWAGDPIAGELVTDDFVGHWPERVVRGPSELQAVVSETHRMLTDLNFVIEVAPFVDGDMLAARWIGTGAAEDGPKRFTGNDILRIADGRFAEYWTGTSTG